MRRVIIIIVVLAVLGGGGYVAYGRIQASRNIKPRIQTVAVGRGELKLSVSATGAIAPVQTANLSFPAPGVVTAIAVVASQRVQAGDILARQDDTAAQLTVQQAQANLQAAQLSLQHLQAPPTANQLNSAQANLTAAQDAYKGLLAAVDSSAVTAAQTKYQEAQTAAQDATQHRRDMGGQYPASSPVYQLALAQEGQASFAIEAARLQLQELQRGPDSRLLTAAKARITLAQAQLDQLNAGPQQIQLDQAQLAVQQAQTVLDQASTQLKQLTLRAPFAGVINQVNTKVGALSASVVPAFTLIDDSRLHVTIGVDEVDIGQISLQQPVSLTLDALPGTTLAGTITRIGLTPSQGANGLLNQTVGVTSYDVEVTIASSPAPIRVGMTASATITVQDRVDVLRVPNLYIRLDQRSNTAYVNRVKADGTLTEIPVTLGLRGEEYSEVTGGLNVGDPIGINLDTTLSILGGN